MKVRTQDLIGATLDWAVAKCEGTLKHYVQPNEKRGTTVWEVTPQTRRYSSDWAQGGPIIEREVIHIWTDRKAAAYEGRPGEFWAASTASDASPLLWGSTPLIAAMRCYCCSKLGDEVDIPDELMLTFKVEEK